MFHDTNNFLKLNKEIKKKILDEIKRLKDQKKIKKYGFSIYHEKELEELKKIKDFDIIQFPGNIFDQDILKKYLDLPIMVQRYIKEIKDGDRRLILIDGEYCGSVARIPEEGNIKANFHAGGLPIKTKLVYRDKLIVETLGPELRKNDLFFVGIDIIGDYLTEINVTSPTGIKQINILNDVNLEKTFWDKLEAKHKLV